MSFSRENVQWQSKDGKWNIGFFATTWVGSESDGYDPEWDVEYDFDRFSWVSTGHATQEAAWDAWKGANPGGSTIVERGAYPGSEQNCDRYDEMAAERKRLDAEEEREWRKANPYGYRSRW